MSTETAPGPAPWYEAFPKPKSEANWLSRETIYNHLTNNGPEKLVAGKDFLLVDLRRNDHEGGTIKTSLNLPAQSFYHSIPTLYTLAKAAGIKTVIFYCGSSTGRGARAARWFQDYILSQNQASDKVSLTSYALEDGIRGWANAGEQFVALIDGYDKAYWDNGGKCAQ